ncbi:hypothetical protein F5J12DRAFT_953491 [Pisolithus orientalis]|uniref:uncharacterized protein n=1 Tax=Pisolithus orientalis TaxID=936130 RepID=UPI00222575C0|nr:uncharacterized protein F5J12DRAFT_953491 [Pisolithus orientalis]KAI6030386.1 hypothetical protein F5J12DRAFT_953491 [Pisolithus orientalis]
MLSVVLRQTWACSITRTPPHVRLRLGPRHSSTSTSGPNYDLIQLLTRYKAEAEASDARNPYKVRAYERAIKVVAGMDEPVRSGGQVKRLGGVGDRIAKRIDAFIANVSYVPTNTTQKTQRSHTSAVADNGSDDGKDGHKDKGARSQYVIHALQLVPGIGRTRAETLYHAGCTSLSDLIKPEFFDLLTPAQQICARFAGCMNSTVTLKEAESVHKFVSENISNKYEVILVGDHRRNQPSSNDVTLLIVHPFEPALKPPKDSYDSAQKPPKPRSTQFYAVGDTFVHFSQNVHSTALFLDVVSPLESRGLIVANISGGPQRWRGIVRIPECVEGGEWEGRAERLSQIRDQQGDYRRLGIFFVPKQCQGAARIVLTGDIEFLRDVNSRAHRLGLRFDEYGLWKWIEGEGKWEFLYGESEEVIFRELGMDYVHPARRNFTFLSGERPRGRPKKNSVDDQSTDSAGNHRSGVDLVETAQPGRRKRGRPRKVPLQE